MFIVFRFETTGEVLDYMDAALILQETGKLILSGLSMQSTSCDY